MKKLNWLLATVAIVLFSGCTVKHIQQTQPSGPSYHQQNQSADKAFKELN